MQYLYTGSQAWAELQSQFLLGVDVATIEGAMQCVKGCFSGAASDIDAVRSMADKATALFTTELGGTHARTAHARGAEGAGVTFMTRPSRRRWRGCAVFSLPKKMMVVLSFLW